MEISSNVVVVTPGVTDYGDAVIISIDGVGSVQFVSANKMRVGYFVSFPDKNGGADRRARVYLDWDRAEWSKFWTICKALAPLVQHRPGEIILSEYALRN